MASRVGEFGYLGRIGHRRELTDARQQHQLAKTAELLARTQADRAAKAELATRRAQQRRAGWLEANPDIALRWRENTQELAWRKRVGAAAIEMERPAWQERTLGPMPDSVRGRRVWRQTAAQLVAYRERYVVTDPEQAIGRDPRSGDLEQRRAWRACHLAVERLRARGEASRPPDQLVVSRTDQSVPPQRSAERAAG
jgi:hypothetical protein